MLKLSQQVNIAKMKQQGSLADEEENFILKRSHFRNIGLAVTEKRADSSICEVTVLSERLKSPGKTPWNSSNFHSRRRSCLEVRPVMQSQEKITSTQIVEVFPPEPQVINESCSSAFDCFRPTRLVHRREAEKKYVNIRKTLRFQSPVNYSNSISIQTEESPFQDVFSLS
jgi:hypothetical protein